MGNCCCTTCLRPLRWTEGVRKEWLSRVPGVSEEGAADPLRSAEPLDDGPLTGTHSREEIESLIRARCDLGCPPSKDDLAKLLPPRTHPPATPPPSPSPHRLPPPAAASFFSPVCSVSLLPSYSLTSSS
ncbi:hypothetical protein C7M84_002999 [Penaeus vannamei]|uniref:Uncharacterized protein n=1 Tax=Penaeus vannamei TaxID=6689 RepID=A0A3R7SW96_PENVA|nr:hypothetical protein C7M84_002999 [Penaeus vannamei]